MQILEYQNNKNLTSPTCPEKGIQPELNGFELRYAALNENRTKWLKFEKWKFETIITLGSYCHNWIHKIPKRIP